MTIDELKDILSCDESFRIERTMSTGNMDKFQEAICAFANDLPNSRKKGYLLIGVRDDGCIGGLKVDDALMIKISSIRSDGNILPLPMMTTEKFTFPEGDVLVVEVSPSFDTPVRYRGRVFVRVGPRRDVANAQEERVLAERCAASLPTFDTRPCREAKINDIDCDIIKNEYIPKAVDPEVLAADQRPITEQMASLRLWNQQWQCPTFAAIVMFGKNPKYFLPGAYVQYVRFKGIDNGGEIMNERRFEGNLHDVLPQIENFIRDGIVTKRPVPVSILREKDVNNYPYKALRELMMNALMHRDYQSNMPVRLYQYDDRIEISNAGGLYGNARPENFPFVNDYRNPAIAEVMRTLNYVNMFNHGIQEVISLLEENGNPPAQFETSLITAFVAKIHDGPQTENESLEQAWNKLGTQFGKYIKELLISLKNGNASALELRLGTELGPYFKDKTQRLFSKVVLAPALKHKVIAMTHPDAPKHPQQQYYLTELGMKLLEALTKDSGEDKG